jgi:hypothetical protein
MASAKGYEHSGMGSMDVKILVMFALFAPVLMLTAGIFARRENAGDNIGNGHPGGPGEDCALCAAETDDNRPN